LERSDVKQFKTLHELNDILKESNLDGLDFKVRGMPAIHSAIEALYGKIVRL